MLDLAAAFLIDLLIGDPAYPFHPVRMMGRAVEASENFLRRKPGHEKLKGAVLSLMLPAAVFISAWLVIFAASKIHPALGWTAGVLGIYSALSVHDLKKEAVRIYADLGKGDLEKARLDLSRIVGRDTQTLDKKEVLRAAIETVAESTVDGIVSPLFFAVLGGAPLALAYKAVNTLDSMIGHLNERYRDFGFFAAKQDEFWNWVPARLSYYAIGLAAFFVNGRGAEAMFTGRQDGLESGSGNGDIPEACFAGALGLRLGGPSTYQGRLVEKPYLGFPKKDFEREDLLKAVHLMTASAWICLSGAVILKFGMEKIWQTISFLK